MRYRFCSSCTEAMEKERIGETSASRHTEAGAETEAAETPFQGYNCIMIYSADREKLLFCKRLKDPYKGKYNLVGGKIEDGENHFDAAYRELLEETGIGRADVTLSHMMDFTYYNQQCFVEVYVGVLMKEVALVPETHPLYWLAVNEDFFDLNRFAGEGNIGHMVQQVNDYGAGVLDVKRQTGKEKPET